MVLIFLKHKIFTELEMNTEWVNEQTTTRKYRGRKSLILDIQFAYRKHHLPLKISGDLSKLSVFTEVTSSFTVLVFDKQFCTMLNQNFHTPQIAMASSIMKWSVLVLGKKFKTNNEQ